jgi:LuxR family maltose regulon positive regulatory protein
MSAKLRPPRPSLDTLARTRLTDALHRHVDRKLQLAIAPAGFGKTTLLGDFVREGDFTTCWASLDSGDRDLSVFIETLCAAVRAAFPRFGDRVQAAIHPAVDVERKVHALARLFTTEVSERVDAFTVLVLDDYHEVNENGPITQFMDEVLRLLPENLRIVLASRTLPGLTVSRLIVEQQLFGLGEADLRFTSTELLTLLNRRRGLTIGREQAVAIAEGAEGWIAGFLLSVPRLWEGLVGGLIATRGGDGPLYDYLASEAFDRQPPEVQRFLLATSIPETMDVELCTALLGSGNWLPMLEHIERTGLFVGRLAHGEGLFRYHPLVRTFLRTRLRRDDSAEYARLHTLAARMEEARGEWMAALSHLLEASAMPEAADLVARIYRTLEQAGRWRVLADVVDKLAPGAIEPYPSIPLSGARAALIIGDLSRAERFAELALAAAERRGDVLIEARCVACLGSVRRLQGRTREALTFLNRAVALAPDDEELVAGVRRDAGQCLGVQGDFAGAIAELSQALNYFDLHGTPYEAARTEFGLGVALAKSGRLTEAIPRYESTLDRWRRLDDPGMEAEMRNCLGCAYGYRGDYERARTVLSAGLEQAREQGYALTEGATLHSLGEVLIASGELAGARSALDQGLAIMQEIGELWVVTHLYDALALLTAFEGDLTRAEECAHHAVALAQRQDSAYLEAVCTLTLGTVQSRVGNPQAVEKLVSATEVLERLGAQRESIRGRLWLANATFVQGNVLESRQHLRVALDRAQELGSDAICDVHARWNPEPFVEALNAGTEPERLREVLRRVALALPVQALATVPSLPSLAARAFGPGTLVVDAERTVDWQWEKSRELFFLLLHTGPRSQEQICGTLWPDSPASKAKGSLHTAVYRLRQATHQSAVLLRNGVYRVNEEMVLSYDARDFEHLIRESASGQAERAARTLQEAADLYTAPFLEHLEAGWCLELRAHLERKFLSALERLSSLHFEAGRFEECVSAGERLLVYEPYREETHALLIRSHLQLGNRAAAQKQYERCVTALRSELGLLPGRELRALEALIRS